MKFAVVLFAIFGLTQAMPTRSLKSDLDDFLDLIPKEELIALYNKYENDKEVSRLIDYFKSNDFKAVVHIVVGLEEVEGLVRYLEGQGVPIINFLNKMADRLGLLHVSIPYYLNHVKSTHSLRNFLYEIKQVIPFEKFVALAVDKLSNSPDFQILYKKIQNVNYQKLHDNALSHLEIREAFNRLSALGVDVQKVWQAIKHVFGWNSRAYTVSNLKNDLDDFLVLIPREELKALYHKYENDEEMKEVVAYLKSNDFKAVVHIIADVKEVKDLILYLESQGVPIIEFLNQLADRLGLPHISGSYSAYSTRSGRSFKNFQDEAMKIIPFDEMFALAVEKLIYSPDFQGFYATIATLDYQKLHDNALSHPEIKDAIDRLAALGVDVKVIWQKVKDFFGWE